MAEHRLGALTGDARADRLHAILDDHWRALRDAPGVVAHVDAPRLNLRWSGAVGFVDLAGSARLEHDQPFWIASNTKTYTAAAVLRLVEQELLALADPLAAHVPPQLVEGLRPAAAEITVEQALWHTAGLYDYATDPAFEAAVFAAPQRRWTIADQVRWALEHGAPVGAPGERFHYSDTGYVLLGAAIMQATGRALGDALPLLLRFGRNGIRRTWLDDGRPSPPGRTTRLRVYAGLLDATDVDPSFDLYGGGGLVADAADLARFWEALFGGRVFERPRTLQRMLETVDDGLGGAGAGIFRRRLAGREAWSHPGHWGSEATHLPSLGVTIASMVGQADPGDAVAALHGELLRAVLSAR